MNGLDIDNEGEKRRRRRNRRKEYGDSFACNPPHRRSKSATGRNLELPRGGDIHSLPKDVNSSTEAPSSTRSCKASPLHKYSASVNSDALSNNKASLEKDIEELQLRLQQEKSMRMVLERAIGRTSSTLSPGHRHFAAQTEELIAEIELLEEEVTNREQHVLSLYRSIFEQCVSRSSSEQSSVATSPAHTKSEPRRHPSIIASTFCSSKGFPLRTLQALTSINDSSKRNLWHTKAKHASLSSTRANARVERSCSEHVKDHREVPTTHNASVLRTLKDHLDQCPSKLSEEMVRCMAAVYCWLRSDASGDAQNRSPLLSRSSTDVILPQQEDNDWSSCKSTIEISWISTDKNNFARASYAISNYRVLVEQLEKINVRKMETNAQIAFWINMYNALIMHAYLAYGLPHNSLRRLSLFHKAAYNVGGHITSASAIEQSIFRLRTPRVGRWLETIISTAIRKRSSEERQLIGSTFGFQESHPLVCFALCSGAFSDPMLKVYTASNINEELEAAKREFLQANIVVKKSRKVFLPKLLERYAKEASLSSDDLVKWIADNVDEKLHDSIQKCIDHKKKASQIIEWLPCSSRFRYVFSKDLTEKPWWM